jgi:hypothetical protein
MTKFATHLKNRGHTMTEIEKNMLEAAKRIDSGQRTAINKLKMRR